MDEIEAHNRFWLTCRAGALSLSMLCAMLTVGCTSPSDQEERIARSKPERQSKTLSEKPDSRSVSRQPAEKVLPIFIEPPRNSAEMIAQRRKLDETLWAPEVAAQQHEATFVQLWDRLLATKKAGEKVELLAAFPFEKLIVPQTRTWQDFDLGVQVGTYAKPNRSLSPDDWRKFLVGLRDAGLTLVQSEWHHGKFEQPAEGPARSVVSMTLHVAGEKPARRIIVRANLHVAWSGRRDAAGHPIAASIGVQDLTMTVRSAPGVFEEILTASTTASHRRLMPLIVYDLNGDGLSEIILGGLNRVYWNEGGGKFRAEALLEHPMQIFDAAIVADFTGDGHADFACVGQDRHPTLFEGDAKGRFRKPGRRCANYYLELPKSFTAGDVDGDGDLDLWIGQYKFPYLKGAMPTPFYDANDGDPAVLLQNDGHGNFVDVTDAAGLGRHRNRRTFSSSLVDLDDDGDLDLVTVNDFCGVDLYTGDGKGHFTESTARLLDDRHLFGMGHTFADYDLDGRLDMYLIGMSSTTARRLESMGLGRADHPDITKKRMAMAYGNRMVLARDGRFEPAPFADRVARTGWSWGVTSPDFDNDGDKDLYVANGHDSGASTRDYCTRYWCHDIYTGTSKDSNEVFKLFGKSLKELHAGDISWNGYEKNALLMNLAGKDFLHVGFLMGVAFEFDSRGVVSDDLDGDGRMDLLVVEYRSKGLGTNEYTLHVLLNRLKTDHHWIGVRLREQAGVSPIGAKVTLRYAGGTQLAHIVTGDSFSSQHAPVVHFGLGPAEKVESLEVTWPGGRTRRLKNLAVDRYHAVRPATKRP